MNPTLSLAFLNSILVTIGVIAFRSVFHNQCGSVLESTEQRYNDTLEEVHHLYSAAKEDHRKGLDNHDKCILEIADLQGRLEGQEILAQKYNLLLAEHQNSMDNVREFQTELKQKEGALFQQIQLYREQRDDVIRQLNSQHEEIDITRQENAKVVEEMAEEMRGRQEEYEKTKRRIQQRHNVLCKEKYKVGPYYVHFTFSIEKHDNQSTFVVELPSRTRLPHSVFTFLSLIDKKLYNGFSVSSLSNHLSIELEAHSEVGSSLSNNYKSLGFDESALSFMETSSMFRCVQHSIGFVGYGPALRVVMASDGNTDTNEDNICFGRVVRGIKTLSLLQLELERGSSVHIVEAKYLEL